MHSLIVLLAILFPSAFAAEVPVSILDGTQPIEQVIAASASHAQVNIEGAGTKMTIRYSSASDLDVVVFFLNENLSFDPIGSLHTALPTNEEEVTLDLTESSLWRPGMQKYRIYFLSSSEEGAKLHGIDFLEPGFFASIRAAGGQLTSTEPYLPSSYHRLRGYSVFGNSLTPIFGILLFAGVIYFRKKPERCLAFILTLTLLFHARFSIDALTYTITHAREWITQHTIANAGALPIAGRELNELNAERVALCNDGTTYAKQILAYHAYPVRVTESDPTHVVIHRSLEWSYDNGILKCNDHEFTAALVSSYADGTHLFRIDQ